MKGVVETELTIALVVLGGGGEANGCQHAKLLAVRHLVLILFPFDQSS